MKTSKFSEAQIAFVLKQAEDGTAIGEVCRKAGISEATFYNWRKKYAGLLLALAGTDFLIVCLATARMTLSTVMFGDGETETTTKAG